MFSGVLVPEDLFADVTFSGVSFVDMSIVDVLVAKVVVDRILWQISSDAWSWPRTGPLLRWCHVVASEARCFGWRAEWRVECGGSLQTNLELFSPAWRGKRQEDL